MTADIESEQLISEFQNPKGEYVPAVMWFWKGVVTEQGITFQLEKFKEQNITDFFIHPAIDFEIEYLSDRYFELIKYTVKEAKRLGMKYWIYDEYEYPSGTAGSELIRKYPKYRQKELRVIDKELCFIKVDPIIRKGDFVAALIVNEKNGRTYVTDITNDCKVTKCGEYTEVNYLCDETVSFGRALFYFSEVNIESMPTAYGTPYSDGTPGYIDMLNPDAVSKWMELTHERYKSAIGDEFGKTVMGVFTDEPVTLRHFNNVVCGPWCDNFFDLFYEYNGYSLKPYLHVLWSIEAKTPEEKKALFDYRATIKKQYEKCFMGKVSKWCKDNNLIYTGHFGGEECIGGGHLFQGDMLHQLTLFDMPGIDAIVCSININEDNFNIAGKLGASAAKFCGSDRVLCETYTGSGWYTRFPELKRIANRLMVLGVNMIQYMGAYYTLEEDNKNFPICYAPSHSYNNTLYKHYHELNDYIAAFSGLSAMTRPDSNILMFNPLCQMTQDYYTYIKDHMWDITGKTLQKLYTDTVNALLFERAAYDLFSEDYSDKVEVFDGYVKVFGYKYDTFVFPGMQHINVQTAELIKKLKKANVKMIFIHSLPEFVSETGQPYDIKFNMKPYNTGLCVSHDENAYLILPRKIPVDMDEYRAALKCVLGKPILGLESEGRVYASKRSNLKSEVYFICNDEDKCVTIYFEALSGMTILDSNTRKAAEYTVEDGIVCMEIKPKDMVAVIRDKASDKMPESNLSPVYKTMDTVILNPPYKFSVCENMLPLCYEMFNEQTGKWDECKFMYFSENIHLPRNTEYKMRAYVDIANMPKQLYLNAEIGHVKKISVNGVNLSLAVNTRRFGENDFVCDITGYAFSGKNVIEFEGVTKNVAAFERPPFMFISGNFKLNNNVIFKSEDTIGTAGWEKEGFPYYCGDASYTTEVNIDKTFEKAEIKLNTLDIAKVYINGNYAGIKLWQPDIIDISDYLKQGENTIEIIVTSTYQNLFKCEYTAPELIGDTTQNGILKPVEINLYK